MNGINIAILIAKATEVQSDPAVQKAVGEASADIATAMKSVGEAGTDIATAMKSIGRALLEIRVAWLRTGPATTFALAA